MAANFWTIRLFEEWSVAPSTAQNKILQNNWYHYRFFKFEY